MNSEKTKMKLRLFGWPVKHSLSAIMHQAAFSKLGLDWEYELCEVSPNDLASAVNETRNKNFAGMNFTVPHKVAAFHLMDEWDESARQIGAVNCAVVKDGKLIGYNTDGYGLVQALREEFQLALGGKSVVILGTGGAGRAAAIQCAIEKVAMLYLVNRTREKAEHLAREIRSRFPDVSVQVSLPPNWRTDLMINATSLGLHPDDPQPIICGQIRGIPFVFDMIYHPAETKFLRCARDGGAKTANGLSMLLHQGVRALELWLEAHFPQKSVRTPVIDMRNALRAALKNQYSS